MKPLLEASRTMARALKGDDREAWAAADESFHRHLRAVSGNRLLIEAVQNCWDRAHRARMVTLRMRPKPTHSTQEHMEVVEQIRAGDAVGAVRGAPRATASARRASWSRILSGIDPELERSLISSCSSP